MRTFFKAQLSSLLATAVDFLTMVCLVELFGLHYSLAVVAGAVAGALSNFLVNRYWSFKVSDMPVKQQSLKYVVVWTGSVLLNVTGVYILTHFARLSYMLSKIIVAVLVGLGFNYVLQKKYVFSAR